MKPCVIYSLETIQRGHDKGMEKAIIHFNDINANTEIIFTPEKSKELFEQLCDYMKTGEVFDFNDLKIEEEGQ